MTKISSNGEKMNFPILMQNKNIVCFPLVNPKAVAKGRLAKKSL